jgi:hypothetical protein
VTTPFSATGIRKRLRRARARLRKRQGRLAKKARYAKRLWETSRPPAAHIRRTRRRLDRLVSNGSEPELVGPWMGELGFELLYWIPFLNWAAERHPGLSQRMHVVSRGGAGAWYSHLSRSYADVFEEFAVEDFQRLRGDRQKQVDLTDFEEEVIARSAARLGLRSFVNLHPAVMYKGMLALARQGAISRFNDMASYRRFEPPEPGPLEGVLPDDFVAVKFYFNNSFPDDASARSFIESVLARLSAETRIVLLNTGIQVDDHWDFGAEAGERVIDLRPFMTAEANLHLQTIAVSRARAFIGTYGGLSYLAPFFGIPSVSVYSRPDQFIPHHRDLAYGAFAEPGLGDYVALDLNQVGLLELIAGPEAAWRA